MNNLLSYCGLTDARMRASENDSPVQLNEYETNPYLLQLSHHLTSYFLRISEDLHIFARNLQHMSAKLF